MRMWLWDVLGYRFMIGFGMRDWDSVWGLGGVEFVCRHIGLELGLRLFVWGGCSYQNM